MVKDIESITTQGDYGLTITLRSPNSEFLDYLASPYGPRMMSPTGLQKNGASDFTQNYLTTHDLGTGPYTLTDAQVGSHYAMASFPEYWGPKPYFEKVEMPVITDTSAQQLQFNNGQLAAILHDLPSSAVEQYLNNSKYSHYSLPTMMANFIYINPTKGTMKDQATRTAVMDAIDVDTSNPDNQLISNLVHTQLAAAGITAKVQGFDLGDLWLDRQRRGRPGDLRQSGLAGCSAAVHLAPHRLGCRRRNQLPELLVAEAHRLAGAGPAERCTATVFGRGR